MMVSPSLTLPAPRTSRRTEAYLAFQLVFRHQGVTDFQRLLTGVGLGDEEFADIDAQLLRVTRIERVLGIDKGALQPGALGAGNDRQGDGGLAGRLGAVDFGDAADRQAAAECDVEAERAGRDTFDCHAMVVAQAHDGALAERFLDGGDGALQGFGATFLHSGRVLCGVRVRDALLILCSPLVGNETYYYNYTV